MSVEWLELSVEAPPEFVEPLSQIFLRYGNGGVAVEEEGGYRPDEGELPGQRRATIRTYMPLDVSAAERRGRIDVAVRLVAALAPVSDLAERVIPEEAVAGRLEEALQAPENRPRSRGQADLEPRRAP